MSYFFGIARGGVYRGRQVDVKFNHQVVVSASSSASADTRVQFMQDIGIHGSYLESSVLEQLFDYEEGRGLSTTQILADANAQNIPIYTITADNIDQIWPRLQVSAEVKTDIQNAIGIGQIVIIPEREIQREGWTGSGYIIRDPLTGAGAYLVEGGSNGGIINSLLCEFSKYPQIDYRLIMMVVTGILLESFMPSFMPVVSTNLAQLGVKLAAKGVALALRSSAKAVARSLLKKSIKRKGGLPKRGKGKKQKDQKKTCSCPPSQTLRKKGNSPKKDEICLELISISFSAKKPANYLKIWQDEVGEELTEIIPPEWDDGESKPLGYVSGASLKLTAKFRLLDPPKTGGKAQIIATSTVKNRDQNKGARMPKFEKPYEITLPSEPNGVGKIYRVEITSTQLTPQLTQFFKPMTINWALDFNQKKTHIERSDNRVYVTLQKPDQEAFSTYLTPLHLATSNPGAKDKPNAAWKTWQLFAKVEDPNTIGSKSLGPKGVKNWAGTPLAYYPLGYGMGDCPNSFKEFLIGEYQRLDSKQSVIPGRCDDIGELFREALKVNNIPHDFVAVKPDVIDDSHIYDLMLIKKWTFEKETYADPKAKWQLKLEGGTMVPKQDSYGDFKSLPGIPGQNSPTPSEKVFINHAIVKIPEMTGNKYFDPSYGLTYENELDFETDAVSGYATDVDFDNDTSLYQVKKPEGKGEVKFRIKKTFP